MTIVRHLLLGIALGSALSSAATAQACGPNFLLLGDWGLTIQLRYPGAEMPIAFAVCDPNNGGEGGCVNLPGSPFTGGWTWDGTAWVFQETYPVAPNPALCGLPVWVLIAAYSGGTLVICAELTTIVCLV